MSVLHLSLKEPGHTAKVVTLPAQTVIETTLFVSPQRASLPTLVSTENIIANINGYGYELADSTEIEKISALVNNYYLPTQKSLWQARTLDLRVARISPQDVEYYKEVQKVRNVITKAARDVTNYESQGNYVHSKQAQDTALIQIAGSVKSKRGWWSKEKILKFIAKTTLGAIVETIVGIPLGILVRSVLDEVFDSRS